MWYTTKWSRVAGNRARSEEVHTRYFAKKKCSSLVLSIWLTAHLEFILETSRRLLPIILSDKNSVCVSPLPHVRYFPRLFKFNWFTHFKLATATNNYETLVQFSPTSRYFVFDAEFRRHSVFSHPSSANALFFLRLTCNIGYPDVQIILVCQPKWAAHYFSLMTGAILSHKYVYYFLLMFYRFIHFTVSNGGQDP